VDGQHLVITRRQGTPTSPPTAANTVVNNSALKAAIDVLSAHYVCGYLSAQSTAGWSPTSTGI
jgi:hypothetical protein